jgi:glutamate dehydrogenase
MLSLRDDARADLLERAVEAAGRSGRRDDGSDDLSGLTFLQCYYRHIPVEDLADRDPVDVYGAALSHRSLAANRPQGTAAVRVHTPTLEAQGWASGHTVVEVVTDDMPFLVDSVTSALAQAGQAIHLVIHPQVVVRRSITGELLEVVDVPAGQGGPDTSLESWIHVEIGRVTDAEVTARLERALLSVLRDVREAVEDWPKMRDTALRVADELSIRPPVGVADAEVSEAWELLRWLADDHFTFLGVREYELVTEDGEDALRAVPGTGLGILRSDQLVSSSFGKLPPEARAKAREPRMLVLTKANSRSTVHRPVYLDYVGVKMFDDEGLVVGERRFLGLFASSVYNESVLRIPVLRRRTREVLEASGFSMMSHNGKELLQIIETYPRDELFQVPAEELLPVALAVQHLQERRQLRLFLRRDAYGRFMSCLVYLPRDRYTTDVRLELERILRDAVGGVTSDYTARVSESVLARLHFVVRVAPGTHLPDVDVAAVEERLAEATRTWADDFADALLDQCGEEAAAALGRRYGEAFPEAYKEDFSARMAVADVRALESLTSDGAMVLNYYEPFGALPGERRFKIYRSNQPVSLTDVLPVLQRLGVEVVDERPYEVDRRDGGTAWIYDFGLKTDPRAVGEGLKERFQEAFSAVWDGRAESDGFNALVLMAGLSWRQASLLRAYARYLRQAGSTFSQAYVEQCLLANLPLARLLVRLFERRCDPRWDGDRDSATAELERTIEHALDGVASLDEDRILRSLLALVKATLRTNYYQPAADGGAKAYMSFKLDPWAIPDLPLPRPKFEIWVYSPQVEGVHLRFGLVARGGLRWSDRREDFRTEVLGLVKAQAVKNAVIVPVGAKGGFLPKHLPDPAVDREAWLAEGVASYTTFISALLDITDNLVDGSVVPPPHVVRHDGDDPYLVVAADKGTATFSDIANGIAKSYGFWLGDAFASGGSVGYDHKAMGITARGAWESVKRHFRELGLDTQTEDFSVVGVGDMSGDVFGNGMLLSEHIRLVAAFDHRHIFLDPSPDPAASFAERARLFALPRSSWDDYDAALISEGGGVHSRSAKAIPLTPQVRASLGVGDEVESMTPADLMRAILQAPVDLLWNGGIGTYVKAASETHAEVGDKANDSIRIDGDMLRCRVVGEGGNLGCTQRGRIEAAQRGVRINTDAIDNSAGVDTSDHEVNIKILLDRVVRSGDLTEKQRNELLSEMTDDVAHLVLRDNYEQNVLLGNARYQAALLLPVHRRFIHQLEARGDLDRALEFLPPDNEIDARHGLGLGLTSPELSVLVAYSKMTLAEDLLASGLPDEEWYRGVLRRYFPPLVVERYDDRLESHALRREIITTAVVNDMINRGGITFTYRAGEETGAGPVEVARAYTVVREVFGLAGYWARVEALDNKVSTDAQCALYLEARRLVDRATRWIVQNRRSPLDVAAEIEHFRADVERLAPQMPQVLRGVERERLDRRAAELEAMGAPADLAMDASAMLDAFSLLDIVEIARRVDEGAEQVARLYFAISERFEVDRMLTRITRLPRDDRWAALARMALRYDLYGAQAGLVDSVIAATPGESDPDERIAAWEARNIEGLTRAKSTLREIAESDSFDLATMSVALRVIRTLVPSGR